MTRLFLSLYFGILATIMTFIFVADWINTSLIVDVENIIEAEKFSAEVELLEKLSAHVSESEKQVYIELIAKRNQSVIELIDKSEVPNDIQAKLSEQKVWFDDDEYDYFTAFNPPQYFRISEDENSELLDVDSSIGLIIFVAFMLLITASCFLWLMSLYRKLRFLEQAADKISHGDLTARAPDKKRLQVGNLNIRFNEMAEQVEKLLASHKRLTHTIAHELRTPLFRMQIQSELLAEAKPERKAIHLAGIEENIFELQDMIDELLQYAKAERAELKLKLCEIQISSFFRNLAESHQLEISTPIEVIAQDSKLQQFVADKSLLDRAITNLLRNAIKYGGERIRLSVKETDEKLVFCVEDDGDGISEQEIGNIFEPFYRADEGNEKAIGYGLGLAISKEIAILHGGELLYERSLLGGAAFHLSISNRLSL
ncbi:ATP-binding protein [Aliikangiella coralliicola]|uniref:histidine kinase n=1 Tax=Aliikangiella coralliicola TaxID=2592383 RepID=A0A545UCN5_9GAMM|nr:ATP-binding protein [Aliikangiella coralliicola]TQV87183.1 HAMP domain-containing protein [Aliikangiella coralliicola]